MSSIFKGSARSCVIAGVLASCACVPLAAHAALGDDVGSVERDARALSATRNVLHGTSYDLHVIRSTDGVELHEYVDGGGRVFALHWSGPRAVNLPALLGESNARFQAAARANRGNHHVLAIHDEDLEVSLVRLPRGWEGHAVLKAAVPSGVNPRDLR